MDRRGRASLAEDGENQGLEVAERRERKSLGAANPTELSPGLGTSWDPLKLVLQNKANPYPVKLARSVFFTSLNLTKGVNLQPESAKSRVGASMSSSVAGLLLLP